MKALIAVVVAFYLPTCAAEWQYMKLVDDFTDEIQHKIVYMPTLENITLENFIADIITDGELIGIGFLFSNEEKEWFMHVIIEEETGFTFGHKAIVRVDKNRVFETVCGDPDFDYPTMDFFCPISRGIINQLVSGNILRIRLQNETGHNRDHSISLNGFAEEYKKLEADRG